MIGSYLKRVGGKGQRGGVAILTAIGFLVFSVPLITGSLGLTQATSIDARVKNDVMHQDYCGMAVHEYIEYLSEDTERWDDWLAGNEDLANPGVYEVAADLCGETINVGLTQLADLPPDAYTTPPLGDPLLTIPDHIDYDGREFQTSKTVSNSNPIGGNSVTYTITVVNRDGADLNLETIRDTLPLGFNYDCGGPPDQFATREGPRYHAPALTFDKETVMPTTMFTCPHCERAFDAAAQVAAAAAQVRNRADRDRADDDPNTMARRHPATRFARVVGTERDDRAAERARDRCVADGKPDSFDFYFQQERARSA